MRFIVFVKTTPAGETEGGAPSTGLLEAVGRYNQELMDAGVLLGGEGLLPSATGARVRVTAQGASVTDGPFTDSTDLVSGWWIFQVASRQEAIDWIQRFPVAPGLPADFEIRQIAEADDFGDAFTPELREAEERMRAEQSAS